MSDEQKEVRAKPPVRVVAYDAHWPAMYEEARREILDACGRLLVAVEHIGSTSVEGLAAKPIIDILAAVERLDDARQLIEPLAGLGYEYVPEHEAVLPGRRFFRKGRRGAGTHHLHVVALGSWDWRRHLLFRDYLRAHTETAADYERLKRELAVAHAGDRGAYTDAKTPFIKAVVEKAEEESD